MHYRKDWSGKELDLLITTNNNKLIVTLFKTRLKYSSCYQKCRRAFLKFPYFRSYFKYQYLGVYTLGECVHVYARNIESDLLAERTRGGGGVGIGKGERKRRNVRASRHRRTLRLHPIPRFYSLIPLCSPPGSQGDFYSSLRISTLTSRHPQPSPSLFVLTSLPPTFVLSFSLSALAQATLWFLSRSSQQHPLPGPFRPSSVPSPSSPSPRQPREHIASFVYPVL